MGQALKLIDFLKDFKQKMKFLRSKKSMFVEIIEGHDL